MDKVYSQPPSIPGKTFSMGNLARRSGTLTSIHVVVESLFFLDNIEKGVWLFYDFSFITNHYMVIENKGR